MTQTVPAPAWVSGSGIIAGTEAISPRSFEPLTTYPQDNTAFTVAQSGPPRRQARVQQTHAHMREAVDRLLRVDTASDAVINRALALLGRQGTSLSAPWVIATEDGGVRLVWCPAASTDVEIEFYGDGEAVVLIDADGVVRTDDLEGAGELLDEALALVAQPG